MISPLERLGDVFSLHCYSKNKPTKKVCVQHPYFIFQSLETSDLQDVGVIQKPDFVAHPEKYFIERSAGKRRSQDTTVPTLPSVTDSK